MDGEGLQGPLLILSLLCLATGIRGYAFWKSFSYTVFIFAAVALAMYYPQYFRAWGPFDLKGLIVPLLQVIMFGMGSQMSLEDFAGIIRTPRAVFVGLICQFSLMPLIAVLLTRAFQFPPEVAAGIVLVGTSPSGLASNVMSFLARANIALSVTLTAVATLLAPFLTPLLMKTLAGAYIPVDFWSMMLGMMDIVILPIVGGLLFNRVAYRKEGESPGEVQFLVLGGMIVLKNALFYFSGQGAWEVAAWRLLLDGFWFFVLPLLGGWLFKRWTGGDRELLDRSLMLVSMIGIAVIIVVITAAGRDSLLQIGALLILACLIHNLFGYALGYWICRLLGMDERSCRTIALEVGMQNSGLASGIAVQMGKVATVGLAAAVFGPLMNITGSSLAIWWRGTAS
jgi:BASS family bile acid:Na+ symporter